MPTTTSSDETPSQSSPDEQPTSTGSPIFRAPGPIRFRAADPAKSSSSPTSTTPSSSPDAVTGPGDAADPASPPSSDEQPEPSATPGGSSPTSSPGSAKLPKLAEQVEKVVRVVTGTAHRFLTDDIGQQVGLYLADEDDVKGISEPAAGILARRGIAGNPTTEAGEVISLAIALGDYAVKQVGKWWEAKRARRAVAMSGHPAGGDVAEQAQP